LYAAAPWLYQGMKTLLTVMRGIAILIVWIAVSILADIALMAIPILMFRSLNLPTNTKIGVIALCCLGVL
jgi:hypothetical protein